MEILISYVFSKDHKAGSKAGSILDQQKCQSINRPMHRQRIYHKLNFECVYVVVCAYVCLRAGLCVYVCVRVCVCMCVCVCVWGGGYYHLLLVKMHYSHKMSQSHKFETQTSPDKD